MEVPKEAFDRAYLLYQLKAPRYQPSVNGFTELVGDVKSGWDENQGIETHKIEFRNPKSGQTIILHGERDNQQGAFSYTVKSGKNSETV